jgi:hypothetical protein
MKKVKRISIEQKPIQKPPKSGVSNKQPPTRTLSMGKKPKSKNKGAALKGRYN